MNQIPVSQTTLPGPENITLASLPNGIKVISRPNFNSPSVVIGGYIQTGSLSDPDDKLGLAHFTSASLMRGSTDHTFQQIFNSLESCGANLGFGASLHTTSFNGRALSEDLPLLLSLMAEIFQGPVFPIEQVERLRAQLMTALAIRAQDTGDMSSMTFDQIIYAGHPYSRPEDGYPETIQAITRDDLAEFHRTTYGPKGMVIAVVGAVEPQEAVDRVSQALGGWTNPFQPSPANLPDLSPMAHSVTRRVPINGKTQADLVMGVVGPARNSPDFMAANLGNSVLGQFGMMGRIGDVVREQSGLAYYAYSSLNTGIGPGSWEVSAGVNPANLVKAEELIRKELKRFIQNKVDEEELQDSQSNFIGRLPLSLESNSGMAGALLNLERFNLGLDYYQRYEGIVRSITTDMILETARRYWNLECLAISSAGPEMKE